MTFKATDIQARELITHVESCGVKSPDLDLMLDDSYAPIEGDLCLQFHRSMAAHIAILDMLSDLTFEKCKETDD